MTIRLFCSDYQLDVLDDEVATLEILNKDCFRRIISELKGLESQNVREINIFDKDNLIEQKDMTIIFDPYEIDVNDKNCLPKIYKTIENYFMKSDDNLFSLNKLSAEINLNFNNLIFGYPLDLTMKDNLTLKDYLKFLDVKIAADYLSLQDRIIQFIYANGVIQFTKVIVFINLKSLLSKEEFINVVSSAVRSRCQVIFIENVVDSQIYQNERKLLLDEDLFTMLK